MTGDTVIVGSEEPVQVQILKESDVKECSIYDVVLPLPGHSVIYPELDDLFPEALRKVFLEESQKK